MPGESTNPDLPVTVIGGYLGAGKTTLVNRILRRADGRRVAVLVNEFGELPIDADLIESRDENVINIAGGCVCCSYGSDLMAALMDLQQLEPRPDHILIEASDVALPEAIAQSVGLMLQYIVDGVVVIANADSVRGHGRDSYLAVTIRRQLVAADIVLLNKVDLASPGKLAETAVWLGEETQGAPILETTNADVSVTGILGLRDSETPSGLPHASGPLHVHHHAIVVSVDRPVDPKKIAVALSDVNLDLMRAKGFVTGVDGRIYAVQTVGRRRHVEARDFNSADVGKIVCIRHRHPVDSDGVNTAVSNCG